MDLRWPPAAEAFRAEIRGFLERHLPSDWPGIGALEGVEAEYFVRTWREVLRELGYVGRDRKDARSAELRRDLGGPLGTAADEN